MLIKKNLKKKIRRKKEIRMLNKETNIIKAEGKDLIGGNYVVKATKKYKATFDYSLVAKELENVGAEFYEVNGKQFTNDIINVRFKFGINNIDKIDVDELFERIKNYNKVEIYYNSKNIKNANAELRNKLFKFEEDKIRKYINNKNEIEIKNAIHRNTELKNELLSETDELKIHAIKNYINNKNKIEIKNKSMEIRNNNKSLKRRIIGEYIISRKEIRNELYKNGFDITFAETGEVVHYVRFLRSSGSSRLGRCLFVRENLYNKIMDWCYMGLNINEMTETDLASLEAYLSLPTSSIIKIIQGIKAENILFINEVKSTFKEKAMCTEIVEGIDGEDYLHTLKKEMEITNSIHDGQALMDTSLFNKNGFEKKGMLLLRNRFFKGACFNTNIQKWFADNGITDVSQLNGVTRAKNINDIKLILNDTCVKFVKFATRDEWLDRLEDNWGIVKYEKPTHHFNGNLVSTHYQLLNTLNFSRSEMLELLKPTMEYFKLMLNDTRVMRNFISAKVEDIEDLKDSNMMISALIGINDEYSKTKLYTNFRDDKRKAFIKELQKGHVLINGTYSVLFGNPIEMLKEAIGTYRGKSILNKGEVSCRYFDEAIDLLGCRSPHVTMGNLALMHNVHIPAINKYFNLSKNIICINSIEENSLERLSSADFDSDQLLLTDNPLMIKKLKLHYDKFLVPTSNVKAKKVKRLNNAEQKSDLDIKTSINKIGEIINLSQFLNTLLWDKYNKTGELDMEIYMDVCQLDVMSCIEIDSAKKEFSINNVKELNILRKKYKIDSFEEGKLQIKPYFMQFTGKVKDKDKEKQFEKIEFKKFDTTMDYLEDIIENELKNIRAKRTNSKEITTIREILINNTKQYKIKSGDFRQMERITKIIDDADKEIKCLYAKKISEDMSNEEIKEFNIERGKRVLEINKNMYDKIDSLEIKIETIKRLFSNAEEKYSKLARKIFTVMFVVRKEMVLKLLEETRNKDLTKYVMSGKLNTDITIYGIGYKEVKCLP
ncbi:hypothetical protein [Clostridium butyricum]